MHSAQPPHPEALEQVWASWTPVSIQDYTSTIPDTLLWQAPLPLRDTSGQPDMGPSASAAGSLHSQGAMGPSHSSSGAFGHAVEKCFLDLEIAHL